MNHYLGTALFERLFKQYAVTDVTFNKGRPLAGNDFDAIDDVGVGIGQVVVKRDVVASFKQYDCGMRADEAHAAGEENPHAKTS